MLGNMQDQKLSIICNVHHNKNLSYSMQNFFNPSIHSGFLYWYRSYVCEPMWAFLRAGASLTPSPVTATIWPRRWHPSTMTSFCCGEVRAKTISLYLDNSVSSSFELKLRSSPPGTTTALASLNTQTFVSCKIVAVKLKKNVTVRSPSYSRKQFR